MDKFLTAFLSGILLGGVYAILALGVVIIYKSSKVFNIAHGEIMMFLAYLMWFLFVSHSLPAWAAMILVLLAGLVIGLCCERFFMRPLIGKPMLITFLVALVLGMLIRSIAIMWHKGTPQVIRGIFPAGNLVIGGISVSHTMVWSFIIAIVLFTVFVLWFRYTKIGLAMRTVAEDHHISQSLGMSVKRVFAISWAIGGMMAAVSGVLLSSRGIVGPDLGVSLLIKALPVLLLGGLESLPGALVGGLIIGVTEILSAAYVNPHVTGFSQLLPFILMVLIMMIRPHGLFGLRRIERI